MKGNSLTLYIILIFLIFGCSKDSEKNASPLVQNMETHLQKMKRDISHQNPDYDFIVLMVEHHQGAVELAKMEIANGRDAYLEQMAEKIIAVQQEEIAQMLHHLTSFNYPHDNREFKTKMLLALHNMEHGLNNLKLRGTTDPDFATLMMIHHKGTIEMAQAMLKHGQDTELKSMAKKIVQQKSEEIEEFGQWLRRNQ